MTVQDVRDKLHSAIEKGVIRSFYTRTADNGHTEWVIEGIGFHLRVYNNAEVKAFVTGIEEGYFAGHLRGQNVSV